MAESGEKSSRTRVEATFQLIVDCLLILPNALLQHATTALRRLWLSRTCWRSSFMVGTRGASYATLPNLFHLMLNATTVCSSAEGKDTSSVGLPTDSPRALVGYESC